MSLTILVLLLVAFVVVIVVIDCGGESGNGRTSIIEVFCQERTKRMTRMAKKSK